MQLPPQQQPLIVTESRFVVQQHTILKLSEEIMSFTGDDFTIVDANTNMLWFKVDGKMFSWKQKKVLTDINGVPICNMQQKIFTLRKSEELYKGADGPKICNITAKFTFLKTKITANVTNQFNGQPLQICIKGDWRTKNCTISIGDLKAGGMPIAQVSRNFNLKQVFFQKQDYFVTIAPGVDAAFITMLCVAIDEICKDSK